MVERRLMEEPDRQVLLESVKPRLDEAQMVALQAAVQAIHASPALLDYLQALIGATRDHPEIITGLSPRGGLAVLRAAKAWAMLLGRDHLVPEDLQAVFVPVAAHRLRPAPGSERGQEELATRLLEQVPVP